MSYNQSNKIWGELAEREAFIFDLDGVFYPNSCGLYTAFKDAVLAFINKDEELKKAFGFESFTAENLLNGTWLKLPPYYRALGADSFENYLAAAYAQTNYDALERNPLLVSSVLGLLKHGKKVHFFSNGDSAQPTEEADRHLQFVLRKLGFNEGFINDSRNRAYTVRDGALKPEIDSYREICRRFVIDPQKAVFFDDLAANLAPAEEIGIRPYHVIEGERQPAELPDNCGVVTDLAEFLANIVHNLDQQSWALRVKSSKPAATPDISGNRRLSARPV